MDKVLFGLAVLGAWFGIGMAFGMVLGRAIKKHRLISEQPAQGEDEQSQEGI